MKYIFVTGGVVSSLGKGLTAASIGALLECSGLRVAFKKFDPYLNVDPGTMSPFQHGEVYVLDDGAETDLDLGHYERFTHAELTKLSSCSSGRIYETILRRERAGDYLGGTVQVIPHVTDEIKCRFTTSDADADVTIIELGGTVGDMEGMPFLEAMRQFALEIGRSNTIFIHVVLLPYVRTADEIKTKPAQQSVALLLGLGIHPDILACRTERKMTDEVRAKLSLFCNVPIPGVIEELDVESIYEVPGMLHDEGVHHIVLEHFGLAVRNCDLSPWTDVVKKIRAPKKRVPIALVGKYVEHKDAYKSIHEALVHGAITNGLSLEVVRIDGEVAQQEDIRGLLRECSGIIVPGGFGNRGIEGILRAIGYAREQRLPFFGICLGMQLAVIEFARNVANLREANSTEFDEKTPYPVVSLLDEQRRAVDKGGTMRLGSYECHVAPNTHLQQAYGCEFIHERHRHRYEVNGAYRNIFTAHGLCISGTHASGLVEAIELPNHPWFVGIQAHPEFKSKPHMPHPLFKEFIRAADVYPC
ncbi:MAG: CTP synthase [Puniceicoccales bacterium]|jgi:CTP synthase|nr:CTP synthase [Puniceicoccales bacterium]